MSGPHAGFVITLAALIGLQPVWHGPVDPWALLVMVLLTPTWVGALRGSYRAGLLSALFALLPFTHGILRIVEGGVGKAQALTEVGLCTATFIALVLWAAARRRGLAAD